jgi:tRNA/tmRNA/rRNA uracil-C5-methylase (TrmA/RlmC/RlmD family)
MGHRVRARLSVRAAKGRTRVGIFQERSHRLVDIPECRVHHPLINRAATALLRSMAASSTPAYSERSHRGVVRALQVVVERPSRTAQVTIVLNASGTTRGEPLARAFEREMGADLQGLFLNCHPDRSNVVLGREFRHLSGATATSESLGGARVFFPPGAFGQANLDLFDTVLADLHALVPPGARIVEYHAGCGAIGLGLVGSSTSYVFNEVGTDSLAGLAFGIEALPSSDRAKVRLAPGRAGEHVSLAHGADVVIVDPPRKGLEPELLGALSVSGPDRIVYLSCGFDSLVRDARALQPRFRATRALAYALFPFTAHVETLVLFERSGENR